jgi:MtN3 and saliva related transmembrane protein
MTVTFEWNTTDLIGYAGGFILAFALLPQVIRTYRTKSTSDLSYMWQAMYLTGLSLSYIYLVLIQATAGWVTLTFELTMAIFLLVMKLKNDGCSRRPSDIAQGAEGTQGTKHVDESITELDDEETGRDEEDEIVVSAKIGWSESLARESSCSFAANYYAGLPLTFAAAFHTELQRLAAANDIALHSCRVDTLNNTSGTSGRDFCVSAWMERHIHLVAVYNDEHEELSVRLHHTGGGAAKGAQALHRLLILDVVHFLQQKVSDEAEVVG